METNSSVGYNYNPSSSTIGIIYNDYDDEDCPCFLTRLAHTQFIVPCDHGANGNPTTICSTSDGLVVWRDYSSDIYYISNPLIPAGPNSFIALEESSMQHPLHNTHVVLATDFSDLKRPVYHVICAIQHDNGCTFDTYTSEIGYWIPHVGVNLEGRDIVPNTGVSCGRFAFWLTENPCSVLRFDIDSDNPPVEFWLIPVEDDILDMQDTRMQLGRLNNQLGLVVANASVPSVDLYLVQNNEWCPYTSMNLSIREDVNWDHIVCEEFEDEPFVCREMPRPIRFQSSKMEVFLWVDGRLAWWEKNSIDPERMRLLLSGKEGIQVVNGFAHVATWLLPGNFPVRIQGADNEDDGNQDDDYQDQSNHQECEDQGINNQHQSDHQDGDNQGIDDQYQSDYRSDQFSIS